MAMVRCDKCGQIYDFDDGAGPYRHRKECLHEAGGVERLAKAGAEGKGCELPEEPS